MLLRRILSPTLQNCLDQIGEPNVGEDSTSINGLELALELDDNAVKVLLLVDDLQKVFKGADFATRRA